MGIIEIFWWFAPIKKLRNFVATNIIIEKVLQLTHFNGVNVNEDFSLSTIIFGGYTKNVFSRQDGTPKLSYFDNTDTLVVVNVNA